MCFHTILSVFVFVKVRPINPRAMNLVRRMPLSRRMVKNGLPRADATHRAEWRLATRGWRTGELAHGVGASGLVPRLRPGRSCRRQGATAQPRAISQTLEASVRASSTTRPATATRRRRRRDARSAAAREQQQRRHHEVAGQHHRRAGEHRGHHGHEQQRQHPPPGGGEPPPEAARQQEQGDAAGEFHRATDSATPPNDVGPPAHQSRQQQGRARDERQRPRRSGRLRAEVEAQAVGQPRRAPRASDAAR